jgi:protein SCO1/2
MSSSMRGTLLLACTLVAGCKAGEPPVRPEDLRGPRLTTPLPRPDLALVTHAGRPLSFRTDTKGTLTFLFFGYTHCPDVCPLHMANLAWAIDQLTPEQAARIRVIFVTTDPDRDTPARLSEWLANFDSSFVGAQGAPEAIALAQRSLGMPVAVRDAAGSDSAGYTVSHGAHLWAFTPDDSAHVVYPFGITREILAEDIPRLLRIWPGR